MSFVDQILYKLAELIQAGRFAELETEGLEIKPVPANGVEWKECHKSINAFLNTRGGIVVLGVKEEGSGSARRYVLSGWKDHAEPNLKNIRSIFTNRGGAIEDVSDCFPPAQLRPLLGDRVAILYVDELSADRKFVFYNGTAYKRILTGDHRLPENEIDSQEEFKEEAKHARELQPMPGLTIADLDLEKLNQFIFQLNQPVQIETMKPDLEQALPFLMRRRFLSGDSVTVLGALVCAQHPGDCLGFRSHVHGYVDLPGQAATAESEALIVQDKQDFVDNVLQLMQAGLGYLLRNIHVGVSAEDGGVSRPEYPASLLRETLNNALTHRDYKLDRQIIIAVKPGQHVMICNPGTFRKGLLIEAPNHTIPIRRIIPEAKPRNPKLADVLRVFRKWEGRGVGMATLVNMSLQNQIELPYYRLLSEEVSLYLRAGKLLDERMERLFLSFDAMIEGKLDNKPLSKQQKLILSYIIKSEWANEKLQYTILLTPDNNHFGELLSLEKAGLIEKHEQSSSSLPIYVANRLLMRENFFEELKAMFGKEFNDAKPMMKDVLGVVYRFSKFSRATTVTAKRASYSLWYARNEQPPGSKEFDTLYRQVRQAFKGLARAGLIQREVGVYGYQLSDPLKHD